MRIDNLISKLDKLEYWICDFCTNISVKQKRNMIEMEPVSCEDNDFCTFLCH